MGIVFHLATVMKGAMHEVFFRSLLLPYVDTEGDHRLAGDRHRSLIARTLRRHRVRETSQRGVGGIVAGRDNVTTASHHT